MFPDTFAPLVHEAHEVRLRAGQPLVERRERADEVQVPPGFCFQSSDSKQQSGAYIQTKLRLIRHDLFCEAQCLIQWKLENRKYKLRKCCCGQQIILTQMDSNKSRGRLCCMHPGYV